MSRLDIITIAIVGVCLIALIYLLTKVARINEPTNLETIDNTTVLVDAMTADTATEEASEMDLDTIQPEENQEEKKNFETGEKNQVQTNSEGRFLVVAASFNTLELAEQEQKRLAKLGYNNSEIGYFNQRKIVSVIIGRYDDYATAEAIAKEMKTKHKVDAYVHRKR